MNIYVDQSFIAFAVAILIIIFLTGLVIGLLHNRDNESKYWR